MGPVNPSQGAGVVMNVGQTMNLAATVTDVNGKICFGAPTWSSSQTGVATVGGSGLTTTVTAVAAGTTVITCTVGSIVTTLTVTVVGVAGGTAAVLNISPSAPQ